MTEDDAKKKWCPFANAAIATKSAAILVGNRSINATKEDAPVQATPVHALCIGSACMAWRQFRSYAVKIEAIRDHRAKHGSSLADAKAAIEAGWTDRAAEGYCGLAGRPE